MKTLLTLLSLLLLTGLAHAAGVCTAPSISNGDLDGIRTSNKRVYVSCVADAAAATYPNVVIDKVGGYIMSVDFIPGAVTVPTTAMDMTVTIGKDSPTVTSGIDLLGGAGADINTAANALITPLVGAVSVPKAFTGPIVVVLSGNAVNSATLEYYINIDSGN